MLLWWLSWGTTCRWTTWKSRVPLAPGPHTNEASRHRSEGQFLIWRRCHQQQTIVASLRKSAALKFNNHVMSEEPGWTQIHDFWGCPRWCRRCKTAGEAQMTPHFQIHCQLWFLRPINFNKMYQIWSSKHFIFIQVFSGESSTTWSPWDWPFMWNATKPSEI